MLRELIHRLDSNFGSEFDYIVSTINNVVFAGKIKDGSLSILIKSKDIRNESLSLRTNLLSIESNKDAMYRLLNSDSIHKGRFHIIKCFSKKPNEQEMFLDLCDIYFNNNDEKTSDEVLGIFRILSDFFKQKNEFSSSYLQGLYGELFVIKFLLPYVNIASYWQSRERLKFDFSISDNFKIEVKTTIKSNRIHHFSHEQLSIMPHFTFIASVMLQYDDTGFSLKQLINEVIRIENIQPSHQARLLKVLHDADESVLNQHKYLMDYTSNNIRFLNASVVPRFDDVKGVTKAEYDSDLEFCESIDNNIFIQSIINEIEVKDD